MACGLQETNIERQIRMEFAIVTAKHVEGITVTIGTQVTVSAYGGIRVREMPGTFTVRDSIFGAIADFMAKRGCMYMDGSTIVGNGKVLGRDNANSRESLTVAMEKSF